MAMHFFQVEIKDGNSNEKGRSGGAEIRSHGSVKAGVYIRYFLAGGGWLVFVLLLLVNVLAQVVFSSIDYWLAYW